MNWMALFPTLNCPSDADRIPFVSPAAAIPKILHQIYFSDQPMAPELAANVARLKALNPDWEHRLYDAPAMRAFILQHYGSNILTAFDRLNPAYGAALADFFRYLVLYRMGGVYLDIKSTATKPFNAVLRPDDGYLLAQWRNREVERFRNWGLHPEIADIAGGEFQQWHIIAAPGHPFLKAVLESVIRNISVYNSGLHGAGQLGVLRVTGPIAYTRAIAPLVSQCRHRRVDAETDLGLGYSLFENERHAGLFKTHYATLRDPVVRPSVVGMVLSRLFESLRVMVRRTRAMAAKP